MDRRDFVRAGLSAGALAVAPTAAAGAETQVTDRHFYELRYYELRSDMSPARLRNFYKDNLMSALQRAGAGLTGVFTPEIGLNGQMLILFIEFTSFADVLGVRERVHDDRPYMDALREFEASPQPPYERYETRLFRAFPGHPRIERPVGDASKPARVFELRTYESRNATTMGKKIDMFGTAEIDLFRRIGMAPVFFGETLIGPRLPSLTYMLAFDDLAARANAWAAFRVDGLTTETGAVIVNPAAFSQIR